MSLHGIIKITRTINHFTILYKESTATLATMLLQSWGYTWIPSKRRVNTIKKHYTGKKVLPGMLFIPVIQAVLHPCNTSYNAVIRPCHTGLSYVLHGCHTQRCITYYVDKKGVK